MKRYVVLFAVLLSVVCVRAAFVQPPQDGPWNRDLYLLESPDGLRFGQPRLFVERGGVVTVIRDAKGRLVAAFQWFPFERREAFDRVAVKFSNDDGKTWGDPQPIQVSGFPSGYQRPFDPTLAVLDDGRIRIYFTSSPSAPSPQQQTQIYSAISSDGVRYTFEPGVRFAVDGRRAFDCSVVRLGKVWHYFSPMAGRDGCAYHAVSEDGLKFTRLPDIALPVRGSWIGNAVATKDGVRFYGSGAGGWSAFSRDGSTWQVDSNTRFMGGDPAVVQRRDGSFLMIVTGGPRADRVAATPLIEGDDAPPPVPPSPSVVTTDGKFVYVLRDGVLTQYDANSGKVIRQTRLPESSGAPVGQNDGPHNHRVLSATSKDGLTWKSEGKVIVEPASVPDAVVGHDGRARIYFVDPQRGGISVGIEGADGKWTFQRTNLRGADPNVLLLKSGRYRAFTKEGVQHGTIVYAESDGGVNFTPPQVAFYDERFPHVTDSDVFETPTGWVMYVSLGPRLLLAESKDGLKFAAVRMVDLGGSVCDTIAMDGGYRLFFHVNPTSTQPMHIRSAFSRDGRNWTVEGARLMPTPNSPDALGVGDPAVIRLKDGTYRMFYKSFIRSFGDGLPTAPNRATEGLPNRMETFGQPLGGVRDPRPVVGDPRPSGEIRVQRVNSSYRVARGGNSGFFRTGQNADIMLSGVDFDNTGGGLLFNHPSSIASDGTHLLLADTNNNRVLVWNKLPTANVPPDVVIGQTNMTRNTPGAGRSQLNWCIGVAASSDGRVAVADTNNDRILLWNRVPAQNTTPADLEMELPVIARQARFGNFGWPWGVWTDGKMLMATCTHGSAVLIWKTFPTRDNQPPDLILRNSAFGTPRTITSDGRSLIVDDHNARVSRNGQGTFFYKTLPTDSEQPHDFFVDGVRMQGDFTRDGKLLLLSAVALYLFDSFPQSANAQPNLWLTGTAERGGFRGGDGADVVVAGGRVYVALGNENKILVYNAVPTRRDQLPNFAIGAPDIYTNTLRTNFFVTNPVPASNGKSLFVSSDFDARLYVWKNLPDESGAKPDLVYLLPDAPWDNALRGDTLALAGKQTVFVWTKPPLNGEMPDRVFRGGIGSVRFQELSGVALDDKYFYLSDGRAGMIYVWKGLPTQDAEPVCALNAGEAVGRLSSDGTFLAATGGAVAGGSVMIYRVADLRQGAQPAVVLRGFNLPGGVLVAGGHLFVGDTGFGRVLIWSKVEDAIARQYPDVVLGKDDLNDHTQQIGRNKLFWPCAMSFDGNYLWVGEFKFSGRILRFSPTPSARAQRSR